MTIVRVNLRKLDLYLTSMELRLHFMLSVKYLDNKKGYMNWTELETLYKVGHDLGSHTMNHANLSHSSKKSLEYQIGPANQSCL